MPRRLTVITASIAAVLGAATGWFPSPAGAVVVPTEATLISVTSAEGPLRAVSQLPALSDDGNVVVFESFADSDVAGDSDTTLDVFVRNQSAGTTTLASITPGGVPGNAGSNDATVSDDGTKVAFSSNASDLVPGDTNASTDVFVRDLVAGTTTRVSLTDGEAQSNGAATDPVISGDGTAVVFESPATNLVAGDTNGKQDIFVRDIAGGRTTRIDIGPGGVQGNSHSSHPSISDDGRVVAFESQATNLVGRDTNGKVDVFARVAAGAVQRVSRPAGTAQPNGVSADASVRGDGLAVVFSSLASNLVAGDTNSAADIFSTPVPTVAVTRVSVNASGGQANDDSAHPSVSDNGQLIAFDSFATNLGVTDTNGVRDIYVRDGATSTTSNVSVRTATVQASGGSFVPMVAGTAPVVTYSSNAANLVSGDTNGVGDVFASQATRCDGRRVTVDLNTGGTPTAASDVVRGTPNTDVVDLGAGSDRACMGGGSDSVNGSGDNDRLFGNTGSDFLDGGPGTDRCDGGPALDASNGCETTVSIP